MSTEEWIAFLICSYGALWGVRVLLQRLTLWILKRTQ